MNDIDIKNWLISLRSCNIEAEAIRNEIAYLQKNMPMCVEWRIAELQKKLEQIAGQKALMGKIAENITDPIARSIFSLRYISDCTWIVVAQKCGRMSERNAHYIHDKYLPEFDRLYRKVVLGNEERSGE